VNQSLFRTFNLPMIRTKHGSWSFALFVIPMALCLVLGCGPSSSAPRSATGAARRGEDPLEGAREVLRKGSEPASCREALHLVNAHLARDPEASACLQRIREARERALPPDMLRESFGLDPDEVEDVRATTFGPLDAYYLAEAIELRDAARALGVQDLPKLKQAELAFQWVMRQVVLQERQDDWMPPQAVLHGGQGTARERALVFLALLRQLNLDGCLIATPGDKLDGPRFWTAGVLIEEKSKRDIYLFDTRLGLPLPGADGAGIATLAQLRSQPELLGLLTVDKQAPYDVSPDEAKKADVYLVFPLNALAPRMTFLQELLAAYDRVHLDIDAIALRKRFEAATGSAVRVWNYPSARGQSPPSTPARALRLFVAADEGGLDKTGKALRVVQQAMPRGEVTRALADLHLGAELPAAAVQQLGKFATVLYLKYVITPHDHLLRGRLEETTRQLVQALSVLREFDEARAPENEFQRAVARWRERVKQVTLDVVRQEPGASRAQEALWLEDQHLLALLAPTADEAERQKTPKRLLSFIVLRVVGNPVRREASYLLALCWQEKAERLTGARERQRPGGNGNERAGQTAGAWLNVQDWWQKYADSYPLNLSAVKNQLAMADRLWRAGQIEQAVELWERTWRDVRIGLHARWLQARALAKSGKNDGARVVLKNLVANVVALQQDVDFKAGLGPVLSQAERLKAAVSQSGAANAGIQDLVTRLLNLERDLGPGGSFASMQTAARYRLKLLETGGGS
jgi:hypothetical protein